MIELSRGAGQVVAADVRTTVAAFDGALLSGARMCVSVLEATQGANVPIAQTQRLLKSISSGMQSVVDGREEIVRAVRSMTAIQGRSNLAEESYGCPDGWEQLAAGSPEVAMAGRPAA